MGGIVEKIEKNVKNFPIKLFVGRLLAYFYRSLCSMLKCSCVQKSTLVMIKIQIPKTIFRNQTSKTPIAARGREIPMSSLFHIQMYTSTLNEIKHLLAKPPAKLIRLVLINSSTIHMIYFMHVYTVYESFCNRNAIEKGLPSENKTNRLCRRIAITNE